MDEKVPTTTPKNMSSANGRMTSPAEDAQGSRLPSASCRG